MEVCQKQLKTGVFDEFVFWGHFLLVVDFDSATPWVGWVLVVSAVLVVT